MPPVVSSRSEPISPERAKRRALFIIVFILTGISACMVGVVLLLPGILRSNEPNMTRSYDASYATDGKIVYYKNRGWQKVPGAAPETFRSLYDEEAKGRGRIYGSQGYIAGRDATAVFIEATRIDALNPETARIFMGRYVTDGKSVYYYDKPIAGANPAAFEHVIGRYAMDDKQVYYEATPIPGVDRASLNYVTDKPLAGGPGVAADFLGNFRSSDSSRKDGDYLKDATRVYFKGAAVPGADPATFRTLHVEGDQWRHAYAEDANGYYFKGKPLPAPDAESGRLRLLQADKNFGWAEIFYAGPTVYAFDPQTKKLTPIFTRETAAPFVRITRGIYADDKNVYFSARQDKRARSRKGRGSRLIGRYTYLQPLQGVSPNSFFKVGELESRPARQRGEIFEANGTRYFHRLYVDEGAALALMKKDTQGNWVPPSPNPPPPRLAIKNKNEPSALSPIPLDKKFAYYSQFRYPGDRYLWLFLAIIAASAVAVPAILAYMRNRRKKLHVIS